MLYDLGFLIFSFFYIPALIFKGKLHKDFLQRFGYFGKDKLSELSGHSGCIWIQAVSVGEVALCKTLIPRIKGAYPSKHVVLSTITRQGYDLANKSFAGEALIIYFPLDFIFIARKVIALLKPGLYIMIETEIWPNVLRELRRLGVPVALLNGRVSDRSFGKYELVKPFLARVLDDINVFCMRSSLDAERIVNLGARKEKVKITGNMKYDVKPALVNTENAKSLLGLRERDRLFVAGSTHRGEDEIILRAYINLVNEFQSLKLLIAPRHTSRVSAIEKLVRSSGFTPILVSELIEGRLKCQGAKKGVYILNTIGQLADIYAASIVVFIGGSLVKHGGQNPIEAAVLEKPIMFGPYMNNFKDIADQLVDSKGAFIVNNPVEIFEKLRILLNDSQALSEIGRNAKRVVAENRGATARNLLAIKDLNI